jgi:microsomal dipeptidase-like Zn-dependent dipeptidase
MGGNFQPTMSSYRQLPLLVSELLRRGYREANVAGLVGGNFRRWRIDGPLFGEHRHAGSWAEGET